MRFAQAQFLYALPLVWAAMGTAAFLARRRRRVLWRKWVGPNPARIEAGFSARRLLADYVLWFFAVGALLVALARPMYFQSDERSEWQGASYLVALDESRSMLAADVKPSRYAAATNALAKFFEQSPSDQVGLITFSGVAYLNAPLTFDKAALQTILGYISPDTLMDPGTSLGLALDRAARYFSSNALPSRQLVLISDGEDLDPQTLTLARRLHHDQGLVVHAIGVGTAEGTSIPAHRGEGMTNGAVVTRLDESSLRRVAYATGGQYYPLGPHGEGFSQLRTEVLRGLAESSARRDTRNYRECFFIPLALALLCVVARLLLGGERCVRHSKLPAIARLALLVLATSIPARGADEIIELQGQINHGEARRAWLRFDEELRDDPGNRRLLYNRALAAYAEGELDKAMVDFDQAEDGKSDGLAAKALFQKGNAEFRIGSISLTNNADETISHWQSALANYEETLKRTPRDRAAQSNRDTVHRKLFALLTEKAREHLESGLQTNQTAAQRIAPLRQAMDQFHEATQLEPQDRGASQGEQQARDQLAKALETEGVRKTMANGMILPTKSQPAMMQMDVPQIQEGVNMLEDAHQLAPQDQNISAELDQGRDRLANALARQAAIYKSIEPQIPSVENKLGVLRMAMELAEQALDQSPKNAFARQVLGDIKKRLAQIHEQQGDLLSRQFDSSHMEDQAQALSQALDHYQQAGELEPQQAQLPAKAAQTQAQLENVLGALGDKLMKAPTGPESPDGQVMRLEGAEQAFNELQGLRPSSQTSEKASQAAQMLEGLRRMLGKDGQPGKEPGSAPGLSPGSTPGSSTPGVNGPPMDTPPKLDTPGVRGVYHSTTMNRSLRDY